MAFPTRALAPVDELSALQQLAPGSTVAVLALDSGRGVLVPLQLLGPAAGRLRDLTIDVGYHVSGWVAAHVVPMVNADAQLDLDVHARELRYALAMPLVADQGLVGVLTMYGIDPFSDAVLQRIDMLMPHLAAAVMQAPTTPTTSTSSIVRHLRLVFRR